MQLVKIITHEMPFILGAVTVINMLPVALAEIFCSIFQMKNQQTGSSLNGCSCFIQTQEDDQHVPTQHNGPGSRDSPSGNRGLRRIVSSVGRIQSATRKNTPLHLI